MFLKYSQFNLYILIAVNLVFIIFNLKKIWYLPSTYQQQIFTWLMVCLIGTIKTYVTLDLLHALCITMLFFIYFFV